MHLLTFVEPYPLTSEVRFYYAESYANLLAAAHWPCIYCLDIFKFLDHSSMFMDSLSYFSFGLNLPRVISDMVCTCIFYAVAHTQSHISHSPRCSGFRFACVLFHIFRRSMVISWTREARLAGSVTEFYSTSADVTTKTLVLRCSSLRLSTSARQGHPRTS